MPIPKLQDLIANPPRVAELPPEAIPVMLGELERLKAALWARLASPQHNGDAEYSESRDRLLDAQEAANKLGASKDYLYRHASKLPFTVRLGRQLRFSEAGMERYIRQRMGR